MKSFYTLLLAILISCSPRQTETLIEFDLNNESIKGIVLNHVVNGISDTVEITNGNASYNLELDRPIILTLKVKAGSEGLSSHSHGREHYVYLDPGKTVLVGTGVEDSTGLEVASEKSLENDVLNEFGQLMTSAHENYPVFLMRSFEPEQFLDSIRLKYQELESLIKEVSGDERVDKKFSRLIENRLNYLMTADYMTYQRFYSRRGDTNQLPEAIANAINSINLNEEEILTFAEGASLARDIILKRTDMEYFFVNPRKQFEPLRNAIDSMVTDSIVSNYLTLCYFNDLIDYGGGLDEHESYVNEFRNQFQNDFFVKALEEIIDPWNKLRKGMVAPDLDGLTIDELEVSLIDFKGKSIFIDVWATWCKPCIEEFPELNVLISSYEKIEFIGISIDDPEDRTKWESFVRSKNLKGLQLIAPGGWESKLTKNYVINSIPRYILIDPNGRIVSANAPRPSDKDLRELLDELDQS